MNQLAKVTSIDVVGRLAAALDCFGEEAAVSLDSLDMEIRRAVDWIQLDRKEFWDREVRRGWDRVAEARGELERHITFHGIAGHQPACRDEKLALEKAKRRLRAAEEKVPRVRHWARAVEHELAEYRAAVNQLLTWLQSDQPKAIAELKRMTAALESYVALSAPAETAAAMGSRQSLVNDVKEPSADPPSEPLAESEEPLAESEEPLTGSLDP